MSETVPAVVELRSWRHFLAVADTLHFGRAAQRLGITQPPLTQSIQALEQRLGVMLFERTRRSVSLTSAGASLVEPAHRLLTQAEAIGALARSLAKGGVGQLRLDFVSTVGFGSLPRWLRSFREAEPGIDVILREATTDVQMAALAQSQTDAGFVLHAPGMSPASGGDVPLSRWALGTEPMLLALPEAWKLARSRTIPMAELLALPVIIFPREIAPSLHDAVIAFYHRRGATPVIAQRAIQMQTIVNLVSAELGLAWVPESMTRLQRPGVVYRRLPVSVGDVAKPASCGAPTRTPSSSSSSSSSRGSDA